MCSQEVLLAACRLPGLSYSGAKISLLNQLSAKDMVAFNKVTELSHFFVTTIEDPIVGRAETRLEEGRNNLSV